MYTPTLCRYLLDKGGMLLSVIIWRHAAEDQAPRANNWRATPPAACVQCVRVCGWGWTARGTNGKKLLTYIWILRNKTGQFSSPNHVSRNGSWPEPKYLTKYGVGAGGGK